MPLRLPGRYAGLLAAAALAATTVPALAWGPDGHRLVGELAAAQLTPAAQQAVAALLTGEPEPTLAGIANWADETRTPDSGPLHYVNFPHGSCHYQASRDCPDGRCVVAAIEASAALVGNLQASPAQRRDALKNLVHFVGDLHQPLHAGRADDRGGNTVQLQWQGAGSNLHQLWDSLLIEAIETDRRHLAARLLAQKPNASTRDRDSRHWAEESCAIVAEPDFYPATRTPDETAYRQRWQATMEARLQRAGQRLAGLLNALLER